MKVQVVLWLKKRLNLWFINENYESHSPSIRLKVAEGKRALFVCGRDRLGEFCVDGWGICQNLFTWNFSYQAEDTELRCEVTDTNSFSDWLTVVFAQLHWKAKDIAEGLHQVAWAVHSGFSKTLQNTMRE